MSDTNNNNPNTDFNPDHSDSANTAEQSPVYNNGQYYNYGQQQGYNNGQYYNYGQQQDYNNGQYYNYGQQQGYNNGQYYNYGQQQSYNNGQYNNYGQNGGQQQGYNNGQYYNPNNSYNNGQYYGQNAGYSNGRQYNGGQQGYNNGQYYNYGQQPHPYPYAPAAYAPTEPVTNVFYYILMGLTAVSVLITLFEARVLITALFSSVDFDSVAGQDLFSLYSYMINSYTADVPGFAVYSILNYVLSFAILALSIVDIVVVHKKGYPIVGLILFTIFFKPGYFLWRAHAVKQKKTIPVLFTIGYVMFYIIYFLWCFSFMIKLV